MNKFASISGAYRLFYNKNHPVCKTGTDPLRLLVAGDRPVAQLKAAPSFLKSDSTYTVLGPGLGETTRSETYTPFGYSPIAQWIAAVGFTGQWRDLVSGGYLLGYGHRSYFPHIQRFTSPDGLSPFGNGGLNAYAYCLNDPINKYDPSGRSPVSLFGMLKSLGFKRKTGLTRIMGIMSQPKEFKRHLKGLLREEQLRVNDVFLLHRDEAWEGLKIRSRPSRLETEWVGSVDTRNMTPVVMKDNNAVWKAPVGADIRLRRASADSGIVHRPPDFDPQNIVVRRGSISESSGYGGSISSASSLNSLQDAAELLRRG